MFWNLFSLQVKGVVVHNGHFHAPAVLPPGERTSCNHWILIRLGEPLSRPGRLKEEKILEPTGTRTPTPWSSNP
jgi:hypothetical protein